MRRQIFHLSLPAALLTVIFFSVGRAGSTVTLRGKVTDSATGAPIVSVNIRLLGTARGTITNTQGYYTLPLQPGTSTLAFSFLGYQPDTESVALSRDTTLDIALKLSPIVMPEVIVTSEDPAVDIIRKAIAHKHEWMDKLKSYSFEAFSRTVLRRDSAIASITESYSTGYMVAGDTLREVVHQKRQTENIPGAENMTAVREIVNFNQDRIQLFRVRVNDNESVYEFVGPTAADALDNYDYTLLKTSTASGVEVYTIRMTPKTNLRPLFTGTITIANHTFAVMGVDLAPNEAFVIPFVKEMSLRYRQQFALYEDEFWMPTDISITGAFHVAFIGFSMPGMGIEHTSAIYDYTVNVAVPDSIIHGKIFRTDSTAAVIDSMFWKQNEIIPLTAEEHSAYGSLDSTQTLEKQFKPSGPLATLSSDKTGSALDIADIRFDRVEGLFLGGKYDMDPFQRFLHLSGSAGYALSDKEGQYHLGATLYTSPSRKIGIGGEVYQRMEHIPDHGYYGGFPISLMALLDKNDYRDYYLATGTAGYLTLTPSRKLELSAGFTAEDEATRLKTTDFSIISGGNAYRPNPAINDGRLRALNFNLRIGDEPVPLDIAWQNYAEFSVEHSSPSISSSDFDYTRYRGSVTLGIVTFSKSLLFPPVLRVRLEGGTSRGALPLQRMFSPDTRASGCAPFGVLKAGSVKEFGGDRFVLAAVEHNFRSVPFLLLGVPSFYKNGVEFIVHGAFAQTWMGNVSTSGGWYSEAGIGVSRILDMFRVDLTYRFKDPRAVYLSLSIAEIL